MSSSNVSYSVWGIFENKKKISIEKIKNKINQNLNGPKFPIHITISSHFEGDKIEIINKLRIVSKKIKKFQIETKGYSYSKNFFQSIYLRVLLSKDLKLKKKILDNFLKPKKKIYKPHISLFYGHLSVKEKKLIISKFKKFNEKIIIKQLCLAENFENILKWKIIKKFNI